VLSPEKIRKILPAIRSEQDKLKVIKSRIPDKKVTYDEINCVLANVKCKNKKKSIGYLVKWYQRTHCYRKCYFDKSQRGECKGKFDLFAASNPNLQLKRKEFLDLFNNHLRICILPEQEKRRYVSWQEFQKIKKQKINGKNVMLGTREDI